MRTKNGRVKNLPAGQELIPEHHPDEDGEADQKIDERHDDGGGGDDEAREIDLADEVGVADEAAGGARERGGEELPGQHAGEDHQGVGCSAFAGQLGHFAEDDGEDHHRRSGRMSAQARPMTVCL